jgi:hypothetical protein
MSSSPSDWLAEFEVMRLQDLGAMHPRDRAVYAVAAAAHRDALARPWPPEQAAEAARLGAEFGWLLEAAVSLQVIADGGER